MSLSAAVDTRYTPTAIVLHWIMALLILGALGVGWYMADLPLSPSRVRLFNYHKWAGMTILSLAAARLLWRLFHKPPPLPFDIPRWQQRIAHAVHWLLYGMFFAVPLTGWAFTSAAGFPVVYLGLIPLPDWVPVDEALAELLATVHAVFAYGLAAVVALHVAAAFKHAFEDRSTGVVRRLLWFRA
ncbi:MAG: cytochrome b [Burkholderiaceae bacterium]